MDLNVELEELRARIAAAIDVLEKSPNDTGLLAALLILKRKPPTNRGLCFTPLY